MRWGAWAPKVSDGGTGWGREEGREGLPSCEALRRLLTDLSLPTNPRAQALAQMAAGHEGGFQ